MYTLCTTVSLVSIQERADDVLPKVPMELTKMIAGGRVYGELNAKSTKFRAACMSISNDAMVMLKLTFHAVGSKLKQ